MWLSIKKIINIPFDISYTIIPSSKQPKNTVRTFCFLYVIFTTIQGGDVIPRVDTSRQRYNQNQGPDSLYLGYSGNPWATSGTAPNLLDPRSVYLRRQDIGDGKTINHSEIADTAAVRGITSSLKRSKRGVVHLYNMVVCATGCNPLAYKGYGCYCGFLGSGFTIDGIDRCCKMHDWCYEATDCPMFLEYFIPYYWKCYRGYKPICAVEHGDWGGSGSCAQRLCECDRALAECLRKYPCPTTKAVCTSSPWRLVQNIFMLM